MGDEETFETIGRTRLARDFVMSHATASMARVEHPTKSFGHVVTQVDDTWAVTQNDVALVAPFLNGKMLDLDVASTRSGTRFIDHGNRSLIVNEERGGTRTEGIELLKHKTKVFGSLHACHSSIDFGLGAAFASETVERSVPCMGESIQPPFPFSLELKEIPVAGKRVTAL